MTKKLTIKVTRPHKPKLTITVKRPYKKLTIRVKRPSSRSGPSSSHPQYATPKKYRRITPVVMLTPHELQARRSVPHITPTYATKPVEYFAVIVCHGMACDFCNPSFVRCLDPMFKTECDLVLTCEHGANTVTHGSSFNISRNICKQIKSLNPSNSPRISGQTFMNATELSIDKNPVVKNGIEMAQIGSLGKDTILTQKDEGSNVANLEIFSYGEYYSGDVDGIFLFKIGDMCPLLADIGKHNVANAAQMASPIPYVASVAANMDRLVGLTPTASVPHIGHDGKRHIDASHTLRDGRPVKLSDVLGIKGVFPKNTTVIATICRGGFGSVHTPTCYATDDSSMSRSESAKSNSSNSWVSMGSHDNGAAAVDAGSWSEYDDADSQQHENK